MTVRWPLVALSPESSINASVLACVSGRVVMRKFRRALAVATHSDERTLLYGGIAAAVSVTIAVLVHLIP